jgi:hypothetical protein
MCQVHRPLADRAARLVVACFDLKAGRTIFGTILGWRSPVECEEGHVLLCFTDSFWWLFWWLFHFQLDANLCARMRIRFSNKHLYMNSLYESMRRYAGLAHYMLGVKILTRNQT